MRFQLCHANFFLTLIFKIEMASLDQNPQERIFCQIVIGKMIMETSWRKNNHHISTSINDTCTVGETGPKTGEIRNCGERVALLLLWSIFLPGAAVSVPRHQRKSSARTILNIWKYLEMLRFWPFFHTWYFLHDIWIYKWLVICLASRWITFFIDQFNGNFFPWCHLAFCFLQSAIFLQIIIILVRKLTCFLLY